MDLHTYEAKVEMDAEDREPCECGDSHCETCNAATTILLPEECIEHDS